MKIKDLISTNNSYDGYRDDAIVVLAEFCDKQCYSQGGKTYFVESIPQGTRQEQLETEVFDTDTTINVRDRQSPMTWVDS